MQRDLSKLGAKEYDLAVIGGGIFGAAAAYDAAQRGLSVALIERNDFCSATSANSLKMVHGGIRYIQHLDFFRIRQSAGERGAFLRIAPHLVQPLPTIIPTYGLGMKGKPAIRLGMAIYDLMTAGVNRGIQDPMRRIPWCSSASRAWVKKLLPGLRDDRLTGAALFSDGQMVNPTRLVWAFVQSAIRSGAVAVNHAEATALLRDGERAIGVRVRDTLTGTDEIDLKAKVILNAAGPYAERFLLDGVGIELDQPGTYSRDTAFVINRPLTDGIHAVALQGNTSDPDAKLSRGARHMFVAPWRKKYTLVGVWHGVYKGNPNQFTVTEAELQGYLDEMNEIYPEWDLTLDDINLWNAGLVPFGENEDGAEDLRYGHRSRLIDHKTEHGIENFITLIGVRYTTGRYEAALAIDQIYQKLRRPVPKSRTDLAPLAGGRISDFEATVDRWRNDDTGLEDDIIRSIIHNHGSEAARIFDLVNEDPLLGRRLGGTSTCTIAAEVVNAIDHEMALTLADVVFRRTDMATGEYPGRAALEDVASILADRLGWSLSRVDSEITAILKRFPDRVVARVDGPAPTNVKAKPAVTA